MNDLETSPSQTSSHANMKERVRELSLGDRLSGVKNRRASMAWFPWMLCILLAVSWAGVGFRWYRAGGTFGSPRPGIPAGPTEAAGKPTSTGSASSNEETKPAQGEVLLERKGYIIPAHQISISPIDVSGRITELNIVEGKEFDVGEVLAVIDSTRYEAAVLESQAQVAAARARYAETKSSWEFEKRTAEAELLEAKAQFEESKFLYEIARKTTTGAISQEDLGQKEKKMKASQARVIVLEEKLKQVNGEPRLQKILAAEYDLKAAEARLTQSSWQRDNCRIKAPVKGIILTKKAEIGSLINPVVGGVSTSLCEMADLSDLEVELEVEERDISKIREGLACNIWTDAYPGRAYEGYVHRIMPIANRGKGILPVRIKIVPRDGEEQGSYLKPEMNALVSVVNTVSKYSPQGKKSAVAGKKLSNK